jgi:hypothetical protein
MENSDDDDDEEEEGGEDGAAGSRRRDDGGGGGEFERERERREGGVQCRWWMPLPSHSSSVRRAASNVPRTRVTDTPEGRRALSTHTRSFLSTFTDAVK